MRKGILDRVLGFMGVGEASEEEEAATREADYDEEAWSEPKPRRKLVPLRGARLARLVISEPKTFDDVQTVADNIKERRPVIINVQSLDKEVAKRILDFAGGVVYALDGNLQKIGDGIFLLTPSNFEVAGDISSAEEGGRDGFGREIL